MKKRLTKVLFGDLAALIMINLIRRGFGNIFQKMLSMYKSIDLLFLYTVFIINFIIIILYLFITFLEKKIEKNNISSFIFNVIDIIIFSFNIVGILALYLMFSTSL